MVFASQAQADTRINCSGPCAYPYQRWADDAKVPLAPAEVNLSIVPAPCENMGDNLGCTDANEEIQLAPEAKRQAFFHEFGHIWDHQAMQPWQRERFLGLIHKTGVPWVGVPGEIFEGAPQEWFANAYALCAVVGEPHPRVVYFVFPGKIRGFTLGAVCRMIDKG